MMAQGMAYSYDGLDSSLPHAYLYQNVSWDFSRRYQESLNFTPFYNCSAETDRPSCQYYQSGSDPLHPSSPATPVALTTEGLFLPSNRSLEDDPGTSLAERLSRLTAFRLALLLVTWIYPVVIGVGVVGNGVSFWVLLRRGMRRTSACRYLACLAVMDTSVLILSALKTWVRVVWGFELLHAHFVSCKLLIFLTHFSLTAAAWLIVVVTLERFLAVWLPLRATEVCHVRRTRLLVISLLVFLALINSHVLWTAELVPVSPQRSLSSSGVQCSSVAQQTLACRVFPWVHLALYCFLPSALLLGLNSLIIYKLVQHRKTVTYNRETSSSRSSSKRTGNTNTIINNGNGVGGGGENNVNKSQNAPVPRQQQQQQQSRRFVLRNRSMNRLLSHNQHHQQPAPAGLRRSSQDAHRVHRHLAPMLIGVSLCWLLLTTPQTIYNLAAPKPSGLEEMGTQFLVKTVCFLLMYLNHALNFFLYCLTGQRFRQELRRSLPCRHSQHRHVYVHHQHKHRAPFKAPFVYRQARNSEQYIREEEEGSGLGAGERQPGDGEADAACLNLDHSDPYAKDPSRCYSEYPLMERKHFSKLDSYSLASL